MIRVRSSGVNGSGSGVLGFGHVSPAKGSWVTNPSAVACRIMARKLPARMFFTYLTEQAPGEQIGLHASQIAGLQIGEQQTAQSGEHVVHHMPAVISGL